MVLAASLRGAAPSEDAALKVALDGNAGTVERTRAFADLRAVATERLIPVLATLLKDPAWSFSARSVLENIPGAACDRALLDALDSIGDSRLRAGVINSLGNRRSAAAVPALAKLMTSPDSMLVDAAVNALGNIGSVAAASALARDEPPPALRTAWGDALLRVAELLPPSEHARSLELLRRVATNGSPAQVTAATLSLARRSGDPGAAVVAALTSNEPVSRMAALALIRSGEFGSKLTGAVGRVFPSLSAEAQVQVLSVLFDRGDRAAAPLARGALKSKDTAVRAAAARLLSVIGDPSDVAALLPLMIGTDEPAVSARLALSRIAGDEVTARLLESFRSGGDAREAALDVLVSRGHRALVPELLQPEVYADADFGRLAANAVMTLGTGRNLGAVLELHHRLPASQRGNLENALRRLAVKHPSPDEAAKLIFDAAEKLPVAEGTPLFVMLAGIGGDAAFNSLAGLLKSDVIETRRVALRALGSWRDLRPAAKLLAVAREDSDAGVRALAVRSVTTLYAKSAAGARSTPAPEAVSAAITGLRQVWSVAENPAEKNAVLTALRGLKNPKAVATAEELEKQSR
ncbi:MAG: HEAT repeat domain-containing protein [Opitutaceae bacterium]|nr:HEAT repeat domain-containing protein [Opitutaceae bacterium]